MIKRNGDGKLKLDLSSFLTILAMLGALFTFYMKSHSDMEERFDETNLKIVITKEEIKAEITEIKIRVAENAVEIKNLNK